MKNSLLTASVLAAGSLVAAPLLDLSDDMQIHVLADAAVVYESNLFLAPVDRTSESYLVFSPGIELRFWPEGSASLSLSYQHSFTLFRNFSELDGDYSDLRVKAHYNSGIVLAQAYANYRELWQNTAEVSRVGSLLERSHTDFGASMKYQISQLLAFRVGADLSKVDYKDARYTDHESLSVPLTFFYRIRPKADLTAGVRYRKTDVSGGTDYKDMYYFVGAVGEVFSPVWTADVSVGYQERDYRGINFDISSASYDASLIYTGIVKTTLYGTVARDYRTSAIAGLSYAALRLGVGARYSIANNIALNAAVSYGENRYQRSPRAEDLMIATVGASYMPNENLSLSVGLTHSDIDGKGTFGGADYTNNEIRVSASLRY